MTDNAACLAGSPVFYFPYLEPRPGAGRGLLKELAKCACVVVGDDFPCFFLPRMIQSASRQIPVRFELIDSNGLMPLRAVDKVFARAYDFRRYLQKNLLPHLSDMPVRNPLSRLKIPSLQKLPTTISEKWPVADLPNLLSSNSVLAHFPIDHTVRPVVTHGGAKAAKSALESFVKERLAIYGDQRNQPEREATSGLSPYLHFGHISVHQVFEAITKSVGWTPGDVATKANGSSTGWWGCLGRRGIVSG